MKIKGIVALLLLFSCSHVFAQAEYEKSKIKFLTAIYGYGERDTFSRPRDIFVDSRGDIYIADNYKASVFIFDKDFQPVAKIDKSNGLSSSPLSIAVNEAGMIYIAEEGIGDKSGRLLSFNIRGEFKKQIELKGFEGADTFSAVDLAIDKEGNLYLAGGRAGLTILDKTGKYILNIQPGKSIKEKSEINGVALGEKNRIYLLSRSADCIYVYDRQGNFIFKFGIPGGTTGCLSSPRGISIDNKAGRVYVMDYMRHTLLVYKLGKNEKGEFRAEYLFEYGGAGSGAGWFQFPIGISLGPDGKLFIADCFNRRVQVFSTK